MKALTVQQPWADLIAAGIKGIEVRTWPTTHRGPLVIHSSKAPRISVTDARLRGLPAPTRYGSTVCVVDVVDCRALQPVDADAACVPWRPSAWAWVLQRPRPVDEVTVRGQLGLWNLEVPPPGQQSLL